jgi:modulator of FtsH protease HflC
MNINTDRAINYASAKAQAFLKKHSKKLILAVILLIAAAVLAGESMFVVGEAEQAVVSRFGVITSIILNEDNDFHDRYKEALANEITLSGSVRIIKGSGLHFKMPFVDKVEIYTARLITYVSSAETVNTSEKKQYNITTSAQWGITDPALFSLKLGTLLSAENQLDNLIHPVIVQTINRLSAENFVSNKDVLNQALQEGRKLINADMVLRGIEIKDIQVHRTILPAANLATTYSRMQADREKVAQQLRSEGEEEYQKSVSDVDLQARVIKAEALSKSGSIRGEGDASALAVYADAYSRDAGFYAFWRSLQAVKSAFNENSTLILDRNHPLWAQLLQWGFITP